MKNRKQRQKGEERRSIVIVLMVVGFFALFACGYYLDADKTWKSRAAEPQEKEPAKPSITRQGGGEPSAVAERLMLRHALHFDGITTSISMPRANRIPESPEFERIVILRPHPEWEHTDVLTIDHESKRYWIHRKDDYSRENAKYGPGQLEE